MADDQHDGSLIHSDLRLLVKIIGNRQYVL